MAFTYSIEQSNIADAVKRRSNVMVNAVAGSGKTTTIKLLIETINPDYAIVLMYNKTLCEETKKRMGLLINRSNINRSNIIVSTIHGSATRLYGTVCKNDIALDNVINSNVSLIPGILSHCLSSRKESQNGPPTGLIIIDEAQDLAPFHVNYINKVCW